MKRMLLAGFAALALTAAPAHAEDAKAKTTETKAPAAKAPDAKAPAPAAEAPKPAAGASTNTLVELKTSEGTIKIELEDKAAPVSVKNFVSYVNDKFYDGTVFHRVIDGFMVQGGGYVSEGDKFNEKPTKASIVNEGKNGLKNAKGTLAMARTPDPNSASAQFFINLVDNERLNYPSPDGHGYAVFGKVVEGMDVVEKIGKMKTGMRAGMADVPTADVKILSAVVSRAGAG